MKHRDTVTGLDLIDIIRELSRPDVVIHSITRGETNAQWIVEYDTLEGLPQETKEP